MRYAGFLRRCHGITVHNSAIHNWNTYVLLVLLAIVQQNRCSDISYYRIFLLYWSFLNCRVFRMSCLPLLLCQLVFLPGGSLMTK
jgi:hypothetical protein